MSQTEFPKTEKLKEAELDAWKHVFEQVAKIPDLEKRIKILEEKEV